MNTTASKAPRQSASPLLLGLLHREAPLTQANRPSFGIGAYPYELYEQYERDVAPLHQSASRMGLGYAHYLAGRFGLEVVDQGR